MELPIRRYKNRKSMERRMAGAKRALAALEAAGTATSPEVSLLLISRYIDQHTKIQSFSPTIARFLDAHWRAYITRTFIYGGRDSQRWRDAVVTMTDLTWSVRPKQDAERRRRLVASLPQLYARLHAGLEYLGVDAADQDTFFASLAKQHQAAMSA
jgi:hypothetical protein